MAALQWDLARNDSLPPTLSPAVPPYVTLGLTTVYTVFYLLLFAFIYGQLWLILHYKHKRFSYQTVFLFLCLLWASLRAVLFSFYFKNFVAANSLRPFAFWLLYCCPVCLQFFTLTLMNLYFTQVVFKAKSKYSPELLKYRLPLYLVFFFISLVFLVVNFTCAVLVRMDPSQTKIIVSVRVAINDTLFVLCAISLSICLYKISKMSLANIYLESKADLKCKLGDAGYVVFGVILFVWELLPTSLVVFFFRVRNPVQDMTNTGMIPSHGFGHRSYFFDNPRRYDSDDDLAWNAASQSIQNSFAPECNSGGSQANSFLAYVGSAQHDSSAFLPYAPVPP
ncbi:integral membrane protein GPR137B isoform X2 [Microcaecilia unicolor]|uniref:Integral membrane protein GPR137B isoform X2 n=1 Tax=Microcaecilia unicolor TaxID=1415580 RepID=A0A6P7XTC0_9AMPH|nr:integral membrane protein GPR137B isoform X2 [Microcaecilia unicolor]